MSNSWDFRSLNLHIIEQISNARNFSPGPQHADDPLRLLGVMQNAARAFQAVPMTKEQQTRLYEYFQIEAQQYRKQWHQYFEARTYDDVLKDIKAIIENLGRPLPGADS